MAAARNIDLSERSVIPGRGVCGAVCVRRGDWGGVWKERVGWSPARAAWARTGSLASPLMLSRATPSLCIALRWSPRATTCTLHPPCASRTARYPPTPPAPITATEYAPDIAQLCGGVLGLGGGTRDREMTPEKRLYARQAPGARSVELRSGV